METIGDRVREAAKAVGGLNSLAKIIGMPRRTLGDQISGKFEVKLAFIVDVGKATGYSVTWLATGSEPKFDDPSKAPAPTSNFDIALLQQLHDTVQAVYIECKRTPPQRAVTADAGELYNELLGMVADIRDRAVVAALIPVLRERFKDRISKAEPGSSKAVGS